MRSALWLGALLFLHLTFLYDYPFAWSSFCVWFWHLLCFDSVYIFKAWFVCLAGVLSAPVLQSKGDPKNCPLAGVLPSLQARLSDALEVLLLLLLSLCTTRPLPSSHRDSEFEAQSQADRMLLHPLASRLSSNSSRASSCNWFGSKEESQCSSQPSTSVWVLLANRKCLFSNLSLVDVCRFKTTVSLFARAQPMWFGTSFVASLLFSLFCVRKSIPKCAGFKFFTGCICSLLSTLWWNY